MSPHDLKNIQHQISAMLDGGLEESDKNNLMREVSQDPTYSRVYNHELTFRNFIKEKVKRSVVSDEFIQSIKSNLKR